MSNNEHSTSIENETVLCFLSAFPDLSSYRYTYSYIYSKRAFIETMAKNTKIDPSYNELELLQWKV